MGNSNRPLHHSHASIPSVDETFWPWFIRFVRQEMMPYPGRVNLVARYTLTACLTVLVIMVFRLPGGAIGGFFALLLPRNSPRMTLLAGIAGVMGFATGEFYLILGAALCVNYPLLHIAWVALGLFLAFWGLSAIPNPSTARAFAIVLAIGLPAWDARSPINEIVNSNLWTAGTAIVAIVMTIVVEYAFHTLSGRNDLEVEINDRIRTVTQVLAGNRDAKAHAISVEKLRGLAIAGVTTLREALPQKSLQPQELHRLGAIISLTGRLVDLTIAITELPQAVVDRHISEIAERLKHLDFRLGKLDRPATKPLARHASPGGLAADIERLTERLEFSFAAPPPFEYPGEAHPPKPKAFFNPGAFSSRKHAVFGFRGGAAAFLCYVVLNITAYPGLAPALFTCVVTATVSIGTSRQLQFLRICGSLTGGVLLGISSQIFILPMLDTFGGFLVLFALGTTLSAWILTGSQRISYYGTQIALGFYTVQLHGFGPQFNLTLARDGVVGILLGIIMMWLMFEKVGGKPALTVMQSLLRKSIKDLAQLAALPSLEREADVVRVRELRAHIALSFTGISAQADAVLFERGGSRRAALIERNRILSAEAIMQSALLSQMALLQFRLFHSNTSINPKIGA